MSHPAAPPMGPFLVTCVSEASSGLLDSALHAHGFDCYRVDSQSITSKQTLLAAFIQGFSLESNQLLDSWDVAADLIWQKLMSQSSNRAALIWHNAHRMLTGELQLLLDAIELLMGVAKTVESQASGDGCHPVLFRVYLVGEGKNFQSIN
jgi:hypothetical protein